MVEINGKYFDWDVQKNLANIEKHGVSFKMAASSFFDPKAVSIDDEKTDLSLLARINMINS